jgi:homocysteine S-methyltransferase
VDFARCLASEALILTGGSMFERLRRSPEVVVDPDVAHASLLYDDAGRAVVERVQAEYLSVAREQRVPMIVSANTWRANAERVQRSAYAGRDVNAANVRFARELSQRAAAQGQTVFVAGVLGPRGNAYAPDEALAIDDAARFHQVQVDGLTCGAPDLLMAVTLPALSEARGIARVLEATGLPYVLSFVVRDGGTLLDGTPLAQALDRIDAERARPPTAYMVNCVHPTVLDRCLDLAGGAVAGRIKGLRANTSTLRPEELDGSDTLITQPPEELAAQVAAMRRKHALTIIGGCCGTATEHLAAIAARCAEAPAGACA